MSDQPAGDQRNRPPQKPDNQQVQRIQSTTQSFVGPLPPPAILEHYERIVPGAAERIIVMAEEQAKHRQNLETRVIVSDTFNAKLGLVLGFILGLVALGGGVALSLWGEPIAGTIFSGLYLIGLVAVFVYGSQQRRKERESRPM